VDGGGYKLICDFGKSEYFFGGGWTGQITLIRLGKLDFTRESARARVEEVLGNRHSLQSSNGTFRPCTEITVTRRVISREARLK
jgi:hypothetical protein